MNDRLEQLLQSFFQTFPPPPTNSPSAILVEIAKLLMTGAYCTDVRPIIHAVRRTVALRRKLTSSVVEDFLSLVLTPGSEAFLKLWTYISEREMLMWFQEDYHSMDVLLLACADIFEIYCYLLVLIFLIDQQKYDEAKTCSSAIIARLKYVDRRKTVDILAAHLYFYYSYTYEITNSLAEIRGNLFGLHHIATLRRDELGQETLLNLLLRNYLHYHMYDQAEKLRSKAPHFEAHSNQQFCRYLFYLGKIKTVQLEYTDAKESLLQAARRAPVAARGFRIQCNKWAVIVRLLLGEIPERQVFMQQGMKKALLPYLELTNAVRIGALNLFKVVAEIHSDTFTTDHTDNLITRLRNNVIRTGLRNISTSYSRISLSDVARKLHLDSAEDAESIASKAIRDGTIDATLDHAHGWMVSKEPGDVYSTSEPQTAFDQRITYCMALHNNAVQALRFPLRKEQRGGERLRQKKRRLELLRRAFLRGHY